MISVVFLSNFFSHHQSEVSDTLYRLTDGKFVFIETGKMSEQRKEIGWKKEKPVYLRTFGESEEITQKCLLCIREADVVIFGSAPYELIVSRLERGKLTFLYSERIFKEPAPLWKLPYLKHRYHALYGKFPSLHLLASGGYAAADYRKCGVFANRSYRWGYFPPTDTAAVDKTEKREDGKLHLIWVGRFLPVKHPEAALELAEKLKADGIPFSLEIVGDGPMLPDVLRLLYSKKVDDCVSFTGALSPSEVRSRMKAAEVFVFTSDRGEGWGAVLNEAMNSGCAVVAGHLIGAVPFLIRNRENGLVYQSGHTGELYRKVRMLWEDPVLRSRLGAEASRTVIGMWNGKNAAERLVRLSEDLLKGGDGRLFSDDGPCSPAPILIEKRFLKHNK